MKRYLLIIAAVATIASCKKSGDSAPDFKLSADVNGIPWRSYTTKVSMQRSSRLHLIIDADSSATKIKLDIGAYRGPGTYNLSDTNNSAIFRTVAGEDRVARTGTIEVTDNEEISTSQTEIKGIFTFNTGNILVEHGKFDVKLNLN
jgi:hypothetical protein